MISDMTTEDLLGCNRFSIDAAHAHILVDTSRCLHCQEKPCLHCCPAHLYVWDNARQTLHFDYTGCLECDTCRLVCAENGNGGVTAWSYPQKTFGIRYRQG